MKPTFAFQCTFILPIVLMFSLGNVINHKTTGLRSGPTYNGMANERNLSVSLTNHGEKTDRKFLQSPQIVRATKEANEKAILAGGVLTVNPLIIYDNDVAGGLAGRERSITLSNTGTGLLSITSINITGTNSTEFILNNLPVLPYSINPGESVSFSTTFNPATTGLKTALINILSDDSLNSADSLPLRAIGTSALGGSGEPSLQSILNLYEIGVNVGDDNPSTSVIYSDTVTRKAPILGDEVSIQKFQKAGSGPVTITPLAVFGPTDSSTIVGLGWYQSGNALSTAELLTVSNSPPSNGQTVNVNYTGTLSFDPLTDTFGFYSRWPYFNNRHLYSEDNLNTFDRSVPHHVRIYRYQKNGVLIPNSYVVAFEEHVSNLDFQDIVFVVNNVKPALSPSVIALPLADTYVRDGSFAATNFGSDTSLAVKSLTVLGVTRLSYLKFPLAVSNINSAKLRLYGFNSESEEGITVSAFGVDDDTWTENAITFNNAPAFLSSNILSSVNVNSTAKYYDFDVTDFVKLQVGDGIVSLLLKQPANLNKLISFNSKENTLNPPQLIIDTNTAFSSNASLFVENPDKFPSNDHFVFSKVQVPWARGSVYNANHDSSKVRIRNKGMNSLVITDLTLSDTTSWKIDKLNGTTYIPGAGLPVSISAGSFLDVTLKFIETDPDPENNRVRVLHETLTITSNDDRQPVKTVFLHGLWQGEGEGGNEPYAQEIINAFGFTTNTGFNYTDPDLGDSTKLKGDEIKPSYFVRADTSLPVTIRQMAAYHGCCQSTEKLQWYVKGTSTPFTIFTHIGVDGQTLLPRSGNSGSPAAGSISPTTPFGFRIGTTDWTDATKNPPPDYNIGIRVWKAYDANRNIIPNAYIISNDYLGTPATNYDYNDNMHFVNNIRPDTGAAFYSILGATPSALDFAEKVLQTNNSLQLSVKNLGQTYANGSTDPALTISSINITGENRFEFSASLPNAITLNPQQTTAITVNFKPISQGLKIADLLIYYNNSLSPLRVPLYGIGTAPDTAVVVNYRIKSGSANAITINGKTWQSDSQFASNNLEPYANPKITQIAGTDEDSLYLVEQSSNGDKKPFKYEIPVENGNYVVRLHFAEIYWGVAGTSTGLAGGAGSRVMSVKIENQLRLVNFDIVQEVGGASAIIRNFPVTVTDGQITIDFGATVNRPSLSAVEVYSFVRSGPLAVNDLNLQGVIIDNTVELNWVTTNDADTRAYEIQRSNNNIDFTTLQVMPSSNQTKYSFTDNNPGTSNNYYRIRQVSIQGEINYSKIIRIDFSRLFSMRVSPNPAVNKIKLQFTGVQGNKKAWLTIQNIAGSKVKSIPLNISNQITEVDVSSLSSGVYFVRLVSEGIIFNNKFVKNN